MAEEEKTSRNLNLNFFQFDDTSKDHDLREEASPTNSREEHLDLDDIFVDEPSSISS